MMLEEYTFHHQHRYLHYLMQSNILLGHQKTIAFMVYDSSAVEYRESMIGTNYERELALHAKHYFIYKSWSRKMQSPADFIQTIMNTPYVDGEKTIFLVHSRETNEVSDYISDPSVLYTHVSFDDIKVTWYTVIDLGNSASTMFLS